jgi:hypothetical protein
MGLKETGEVGVEARRWEVWVSAGRFGGWWAWQELDRTASWW